MFSYLSKEKLFLLATRNMSILVKDNEDLQKVDGHQWLKLIGKIFFQTVNTKIAETLLTNKTAVGEYLSKENLILYKDEEIVLHSLVENSSGNIICDT